jgi:hypothetical protein
MGNTSYNLGLKVGSLIKGTKQIGMKGINATKKAIHDKQKKVALNVIDDTKDRVSDNKRKMILKGAEEIVADKYAKGSTVRANKSPLLKYANFEDNWVINLVKLNPYKNQNGLLYKGGNKYAVVRNSDKGYQQVFEFKTLEQAENKFNKLVTESKEYSPIVKQGKIEGNYAKGGAATKKLGLGGRVTNINDAIATSDLKDELRSKMEKGDDVIHFAFTDYGGDFMDKVAIEYFEENYPKNTLSETTAYYGKNAFVFGKPATEWIEASEDYPLGFEDFESYYYEKQNEQENEDFERFLDDLKRDGYEVSDEAIGWLNENRGGYYSMTTQGLDFSYEDLTDDLKEEGLITKDEMAEGGSTKGFNYSIGGL